MAGMLALRYSQVHKFDRNLKDHCVARPACSSGVTVSVSQSCFSAAADLCSAEAIAVSMPRRCRGLMT